MYPHPFEALTAAKPSLNERALHNLRMILVGCPACGENTSDELRNSSHKTIKIIPQLCNAKLIIYFSPKPRKIFDTVSTKFSHTYFCLITTKVMSSNTFCSPMYRRTSSITACLISAADCPLLRATTSITGSIPY